MTVLTFGFAALFAAIHLFIGQMRFLDVVPRSRWLSLSGGVAVSYVFLQIIPELAAHQSRLAEQAGGGPFPAEQGIYLATLAGAVGFYGLERLARSSGSQGARGTASHSPVFWLHIGSFAVYKILIGSILHERQVAGFGP